MEILQSATLALVVASACYALLTVVATRRFFRISPSAPTPQSSLPPVTILKPVCGLEAEAEENFRSFLAQNYPEFQVIFGALEPHDAALALACNLTPRPVPSPGGGEPEIVCAANSRVIGTNLKVSNLFNMMEHARHDLLVIADSDMRVTPNYLREIVAPFADPRVGLVTCPYRGAMPREATGWQRIVIALQAHGVTADFQPGVMLAHLYGMRGFAFGSTIAIRRTALAELGGFERLRNHLADDYWLGQLVQQAGYRVVLARTVVDNVLSAEPFRVMFARRLRWARTVKVCQPAGHVGSFITHLIPLALLHLLVRRGAAPAGQVLAAAIGLRAFVVWLNNRLLRDRVMAQTWWLLPVNDLLGALVFLLSLWPGPILWRGQRFRVTKKGVLQPEPPEV